MSMQLGWIALLLSGTAVLVRPPLASAQGPSRPDLIDAFYELRNQAKDAYRGGFKEIQLRARSGGNISVKTVNETGQQAVLKYKGVDIRNDTAGGTKQMIKVWARPVVNGVESTKKVNLETYKWRPREQLYVYFESATPVTVAFLQDFQGQPSQTVFPDPKFPESYNVIEPKGPVRFPIKIELDDDTSDELMTIAMQAAGTGKTGQISHQGDGNLANQDFLVFARDFSRKATEQAKTSRLLLKFRPTDDQNQTNGDPDDVATIGYGSGESGRMQLRLQKRSN